MDEEAYIEEWAYVLMNMVAAEEHLIESYIKTSDEYYLELADVQRSLRQLFVSTLYSSTNDTITLLKEVLDREGAIMLELIKKFKSTKTNLDTGDERTSHGELWCTIKHLSSIKMHLVECLQKKIREVNE